MIISTPQTILAVEALLAIPFMIMGLSHLCQPRMWHDVFVNLANKAQPGVVERSFLFELWPAVLIVVFHQDWAWPGLVLTIYGHLLLAKVAVSLLFPVIGLKSLRMAQKHGPGAFRPAGIVLCALGLLCGARVVGLLG